MPEQKSLRHLWREWRSFVLFAICLLFFRTGIADWNVVPTGSMNPTILEGDRILVDRLAYDAKLPLTDITLARLGEPRRNDVVVFASPRNGTRLVKRLVGLPGDVVELRDNRLLINGRAAGYEPLSDAELGQLGWQPDAGRQLLTETIDGRSHPIAIGRNDGYRYRSFGPVRVPAGHYLMLGDNRDNSADSRFFGFVPRALLIGRSDTVVASLDPEHYYLPRGGRFWHPLP